MEIAQEFGDLHVLLPYVFGRDVRPRLAEGIQPFEIILVVGLVPGVAESVELAVAREGRELLPDQQRRVIQFVLRIERTACEDVEYLSGPLPHCFAGLHLDTLEEARAEVMKRAEDTEYCFAIVLKETGKVIGEIDAEQSDYRPPMLRSRETSLPPPDTFTPSLILNSAHRGGGFAYEATYGLFDYLFARKGVRRIYSYVDDYNAASRHLCEKLGMRREGLFQSFVSFVDDADGNPVYENTLQYAILNHEWMAARKCSAI